MQLSMVLDIFGESESAAEAICPFCKREVKDIKNDYDNIARGPHDLGFSAKAKKDERVPL